MRVGQYIIVSLILHAVLITACFYLVHRERTCALPRDSVIVSLVGEMTATESTESIDSSYLSPPQLPTISGGMYSDLDNSKVDTTILVNQHSGISGETDLLLSNIKETESNAPLPSFTKGGLGGLPEQDAASQNTGKSRPGDEIRENITVETNNKEDTSLYALIRALLERARSYPLLARKRGMEGTVLVCFTIDRKGLPQDVKIMKSSGYQILDEEARKMLIKASPFPGVRGEIVIPITFKLGDSISNR